VLALVGALFLAACGASLDNAAVGSVAVTDQKAAAGDQPAGLSTDAAPSGGPVVRAADKRSAAPAAAAGAYRVGPLDVLEFSVFQVPELTRSVQVSDGGTINLPLVGEVDAAGKTARELERELAKELGAKYLQKPQVSIYVREYNSQMVTIAGAVKKPGVYPIRGKLTLLQLVATAQGLESTSDSTVLVFRQQDGKRAAARFEIEDIRGGQASDPPLQAGDVVVAGTSAIKETFNNILKALPLAGVFAML